MSKQSPFQKDLEKLVKDIMAHQKNKKVDIGNVREILRILAVLQAKFDSSSLSDSISNPIHVLHLYRKKVMSELLEKA